MTFTSGLLYQFAFTHFPEAFLSGTYIAEGVVGIVKVANKKLSMEFLKLRIFEAVLARNTTIIG